MPKVTDGGQAGMGPKAGPQFTQAPCGGCWTEDSPNTVAVATGACSLMRRARCGPASPSPCPLPTLPSPCRPGPLQLGAHDTLGVGLGVALGREEDDWGKKIENSETGQMGPWWGAGESRKKKRGRGRAAYTQGIYFYTHLYTHLDIVHVKIYAIHTPASCQVPREPAVALVGMGEQRGVC